MAESAEAAMNEYENLRFMVIPEAFDRLVTDNVAQLKFIELSPTLSNCPVSILSVRFAA